MCILCTKVDSFAQTGIFAGLGTEINANSPQGPAVSGGLAAGLDMFNHFALGLKAAYNTNLQTESILEPQLFIRYYFAPGFIGPFSQGDAGCAIISSGNDTHYVFTGGLQAGWRFIIAETVFLEPAMRIGYPFLFGVNLTLNIKFPIARQRAGTREQVAGSR